MIAPSEFLAFAKSCIDPKQPTEFSSRMAAARAYYGVLLLVRDHLKITHAQTQGRTHQLVKETMYSVPPAQTPMFLTLAKRHWATLKDLREEADYDIASPFSTIAARDAVARAEAIFKVFPK
jgi:hypothetical protein